MADRSLIVRIIGDAKSLINSFRDANRATQAFGQQRVAILRGVEKEETDSLLRLKAKRAQSLGLFRVGAATLGGGAAIFAGIQGLRALADGLRVTGDEAFTTEGRIRNLGAALASADIVGGLRALTAQESRLAPDLEKAVSLLGQMREEASRVSLGDVVGDTDKFHAAASQATKDMVSIGIPIDEATDKTTAWVQELQRAAGVTVDLGGTFETIFGRITALIDDATKKAIAARKEGLDKLAELPPGIGAAIAREQGPEGSQGGLLKVLQQADANLAKRIDQLRNESGRDVSERLERLQRQRNAIFDQIQDILHPPKVKTSTKTDTSAADAMAKAIKAQKDAFARAIGLLDIRLDRARITAGFNDDLRLLDEMEAAVKAQIVVEGRTVELERRLFTIEQERVRITQERAANQKEAAQAAEQVRQFRALGLSAEGNKPIPTIDNLTQQLDQLDEKVAGGRNQKLLNAIRKVLTDPLHKATEETRAKIKELFDTIRDGFEQGSQGPLTATTGLNTKKIVEGLGLDAVTAQEIRGRLSGFNTAGRALAPPTSSNFVGAAVGVAAGPIVVDNNITIEIDGEKLASRVTKSQQKTRRRNPQQKRGPNRIGGV